MILQYPQPISQQKTMPKQQQNSQQMIIINQDLQNNQQILLQPILPQPILQKKSSLKEVMQTKFLILIQGIPLQIQNDIYQMVCGHIDQEHSKIRQYDSIIVILNDSENIQKYCIDQLNKIQFQRFNFGPQFIIGVPTEYVIVSKYANSEVVAQGIKKILENNWSFKIFENKQMNYIALQFDCILSAIESVSILSKEIVKIVDPNICSRIGLSTTIGTIQPQVGINNQPISHFYVGFTGVERNKLNLLMEYIQASILKSIKSCELKFSKFSYLLYQFSDEQSQRKFMALLKQNKKEINSFGLNQKLGFGKPSNQILIENLHPGDIQELAAQYSNENIIINELSNRNCMILNKDKDTAKCMELCNQIQKDFFIKDKNASNLPRREVSFMFEV
eukprot:TRINITY_DN438_c0_g2_i8.p1 TRINITY_DN438_c0_g2~~TRINITY_DN438_c0_g2_i8.p1  ORF type:complete len:391 (+),score=60.53 TRINITY_DN438_c0_g2_i8:256-1428(+)